MSYVCHCWRWLICMWPHRTWGTPQQATSQLSQSNWANTYIVASVLYWMRYFLIVYIGCSTILLHLSRSQIHVYQVVCPTSIRKLPHVYKYDLWKPPLYLKSKPTNCYVPVVSMFTGRTPVPCIHASHILSSVCIHQNLLDKQPENLCNNTW